MLLDLLRDSIATWARLIALPFMAFSLVWRMIPVYLNGFLASVYFPPSSPAAVFGGLTALWAGADWIRGYVVGGQTAAKPNWVVAIVFCAWGAFAMLAGLLKIKKLYPICGRRSILTFFAVSLYPVQAGHASYSKNLIIAIIVVAVPAIVVLELFAVHMRKNILKVEEGT